MCAITADPMYSDAALVQHATLTIFIQSASNLMNRNWFSQSNPFVLLSLGRNTAETKVVASNLNPEWKETIKLQWDGISPLTLSVFDKGSIFADCKFFNKKLSFT